MPIYLNYKMSAQRNSHNHLSTVVKRRLNIEVALVDQENDRSIENQQQPKLARTAKAQEKRVSISGILGFHQTQQKGVRSGGLNDLLGGNNSAGFLS
jgi:hypothetical protein